ALCSYARTHHRLGSFPTRRSSDLVAVGREGEEGRLFRRDRARRIARHRLLAEIQLALTEEEPARARLGKLGGVLLRRDCEAGLRSEEHTSELQSPYDLVCRLLLEK